MEKYFRLFLLRKCKQAAFWYLQPPSSKKHSTWRRSVRYVLRSIRMILKMKSAAASEHRARILLSAWNSGDLRRLRETLTQSWNSLEPSAWPLTGEDECERMEMLATIADAMRDWLRRGGEAPTEDLQVSVKLLQHLARTESLWREKPRVKDPGSLRVMSRSGRPAFSRS
jgi:hypothetical protein